MTNRTFWKPNTPLESLRIAYLPDASWASVENTLAESMSPRLSAVYCSPVASCLYLALLIP